MQITLSKFGNQSIYCPFQLVDDDDRGVIVKESPKGDRLARPNNRTRHVQPEWYRNAVSSNAALKSPPLHEFDAISSVR
jgi:hypothetical protein